VEKVKAKKIDLSPITIIGDVKKIEEVLR